MRKPAYLSPSALQLFEKSRDEYYMRYLAGERTPGIPQTLPMAVGSAFDAMIKSYLHEGLFGKGHVDAAKYDLDALFVSQVEPHVRDSAWKAGKLVFDQYIRSGAAAELLLGMSGAIVEPRFEFSVSGTVRGVPLLGKPDAYYVNKSGIPVILDFKVNGYCGTASPKAGFVRLLDHTGRVMPGHKSCMPVIVGGVEIDGGTYFENRDEGWAMQLCTYAWLLGVEVGSEVIIGIHQICCSGFGGESHSPNGVIRVAVHAGRVSQGFQNQLIQRYRACWEWAIGHDGDASLDQRASLGNSSNPDIAAAMLWSRRSAW